ncbi:NAD-dependent epimerase/dehydratase family protein [Nonomuraea insulae]|uniref:NAD-dependent epimerase/dehydratase family protein n=1 Tax=Nonomuraea insulae TaxID=1616787 RepID=A0ABW1CUU8_9ACTN
MRVFVAGGTGAIGGHTIPALLKAGHEVTALARTPDKAATLATQGARPVRVSLFDREALAQVLPGHDAVVNLASSMPPMSRFMSTKAMAATHHVRTEGSAALADAARTAGVGRMVQESVSMLYRDQGARWITEDAPVDHYPLTRGNFAAETAAHRFTRTGGTGVVLRFGWFYGPGAAHSEQLFALARAAGAAAWLTLPGRAAHLFGHRLTSLTRSLRVSNTRFRTTASWTPRYRSAREGWLATAPLLNP